MSGSSEPFFQPFEGADYRNSGGFPGRLLIVGESYYLAPEDHRADFTADLMRGVIQEGRRGARTRYYTNLFQLFTGRRSGTASEEEWQTFWNSIAFYIFIQSRRLTAPLMRPNAAEWNEALAPFRTVLARSQPDRVLLTGSQLCGHASKLKISPRGERPGFWLPTGTNTAAYARCIPHPSSRSFTARKHDCRDTITDLLQ